MAIAAARAERDAYAGAWKLAHEEGFFTAVDRARRYGPLLVAARAEGKAKEALEAVPAPPPPQDRYGIYEMPLLYELALTRLEAGDLDEAALLCQELVDATPDFAPGHFCLGRVAEAHAAWTDAFREYRQLLDRWVDADESNRLVIETRRRLATVLVKARAGK